MGITQILEGFFSRTRRVTVEESKPVYSPIVRVDEYGMVDGGIQEPRLEPQYYRGGYQASRPLDTSNPPRRIVSFEGGGVSGVITGIDWGAIVPSGSYPLSIRTTGTLAIANVSGAYNLDMMRAVGMPVFSKEDIKKIEDDLAEKQKVYNVPETVVQAIL